MDQLLEDVLDQLRGMWLRRFWGLAAAWVVGIVALAAAFVVPLKYEASARVFVDTDSVLKPLMAGLTVQPNIEQQVAMLTSTLLSRPNVEKLIDLADLDPNGKSGKDQSALVQRVTRTVQLTGSTKDNLFSLSYRDTDPARAKRTVEALLSMFVESGSSNKRRDTDNARAFLDAQIKQYETVLDEAERRLKDFKLQNLDHLADSQDQVGNMLTVDREIEKSRMELRASEQRRDALRKQLESERAGYSLDTGGADSTPGRPRVPDAISDIDARADVLRRNLDELLRKYTDDHPDVVGTRRILADLEKQREALIEARRRAGPEVSTNDMARLERSPVYQQIKVALADAEGNVAALRSTLSELESRYARIRANARLKPEFDQELGQLNREYQVQKSNFEQLVQRREAAKMTEQLDETGGQFRVIDPPRVSPTPVAPNRLQLILAALLLSVGTGLACSFIANRAFPTVSTVKALRAVTQAPVLGSVSHWRTPAMVRSRRRDTYAFAGGVTGLCVMFGLVLTAFFAAKIG